MSDVVWLWVKLSRESVNNKFYRLLKTDKQTTNFVHNQTDSLSFYLTNVYFLRQPGTIKGVETIIVNKTKTQNIWPAKIEMFRFR